MHFLLCTCGRLSSLSPPVELTGSGLQWISHQRTDCEVGPDSVWHLCERGVFGVPSVAFWHAGCKPKVGTYGTFWCRTSIVCVNGVISAAVLALQCGCFCLSPMPVNTAQYNSFQLWALALRDLVLWGRIAGVNLNHSRSLPGPVST